jgi:hypothetical protein
MMVMEIFAASSVTSPCLRKVVTMLRIQIRRN